MRKTWTLVLLLLLAVPLPAAFDSALAPYPERNEQPYGPAAEELLARAGANAPGDGAFSATVRWSAESARRLDPTARSFGLFSLKSRPDWRFSRRDDGSKEGSYTIAAVGADWRIDAIGGEDWWHKAGEHIYSKVFSADWPTVWRLHHDALESGMLGYLEGLGLLLWAFNPDEYLRRAEGVEVGEDRVIARKTCATLVATPTWLSRPGTLESTDAATRMSSWATHRPAITYFFDRETGAVVGAEFVFYTAEGAENAEGFTVQPRASGLVVTCSAQQMAETGGTRYPTHIAAEVLAGGEVVRRTTLEITLGDPPAAVPQLVLPEDKYVVDPWPQYRIDRYQAVVSAGQATLADLIGFARAVCREGDAPEGELLLLDVVKALQEGPRFQPARRGAIDWEVGEAFTSLIDRYTPPQIEGLWQRVPRNPTWLEVSARGVRLYQKLRPSDKAKIDLLFERFQVIFEEPRQQELEKESLRNYRAFLEAELKRAQDAGLADKVSRIEKLLQDIEAQLAAGKEGR
jgi:hypothetical protein